MLIVAALYEWVRISIFNATKKTHLQGFSFLFFLVKSSIKRML